MTALATAAVHVEVQPVVIRDDGSRLFMGPGTATYAGLEMDVMVVRAMLPSWEGFRHPSFGNPLIEASLSTPWLDFAGALFPGEKRLSAEEHAEIESVIERRFATGNLRRRGESRR